MLQLPGRVHGQSTVDRSGLEHGAFGGLEEAEPLTQGLRGRSSSAVLASAHTLNESQRGAKSVQVETGIQDTQSVRVAVPGGSKEVRRLAVDNHPHVDELLALRSRHAAQDDVLIGVGAHDAPPGNQSRVASRALRKAT